MTALALAMVALAVAACGGGSTPTGVFASLSPRPVASAATTFPGWPTGPEPDAAMVPIIVSNERVVGPNRFLYALVDTANKPIAAPSLTTTVRFYDLAADPTTPVTETEGSFIWTVPDELGLYHAAVDFSRAGPWGVEIEASADGQPDRTARAVFDVRPASATPAIGTAAPPSDTPTATDPAASASFTELR